MTVESIRIMASITYRVAILSGCYYEKGINVFCTELLIQQGGDVLRQNGRKIKIYINVTLTETRLDGVGDNLVSPPQPRVGHGLPAGATIVFLNAAA